MRLVLSLVAVAFLLAPATAADEKPKLNVVFLMADDLRPELGCYGHPSVKSPNIDGLAKAGVKFERAYCQFPLCNPSRTSLLTGRHPTTTGVLDNRVWFGADHPDIVSLPAHFKKNGYVTLRSGKIFHGGIDDADAWTEGGQKRNFEGKTAPASTTAPADRAKQSDRRVVLQGDGESHNDYKTATRAIELLEANKDRPFFLACGFTKPHSPPTAPKKFYDLYDAAKIPLPKDFAARAAALEGFPKASIRPNGDLFINRDATEEEARQMIQAYWASLSWMDWNVGRVLEALDRLKLRDNTIVLFWGDHGYHLGEKGKWAKHGSLYEVGSRVPLIVHAPKAKANGKASGRVVQALDIYPTLCDLCGLKAAEGLEGHSLTTLLDDAAAKWEHPAYTVLGNGRKVLGVAVRTDRFRYAEYDGGDAMLIDMQADPTEQKNLVDDPKFAEEVKRLSALVKKHSGKK